MTYYYSWGPVRGRCPHNHRTPEGVAACLERDSRGCRRQGGYSDRAPYKAPGDPGRRHPLYTVEEGGRLRVVPDWTEEDRP